MTEIHHEPVPTSIEEIRTGAAAVAEAMRRAGKGPIPPDVRKRFIEIRSALFQRGIFDPVLARFDSATVPQAPLAEIADQLAAVASAL
jgi:hypothetical protein